MYFMVNVLKDSPKLLKISKHYFQITAWQLCRSQDGLSYLVASHCLSFASAAPIGLLMCGIKRNHISCLLPAVGLLSQIN